MDGPGFHVEIGALEAAAAAVTESVAEQRRSALDQVDREAATYGHAGLHASLETFCDRWSDGIDILLDDAGAIGDILGAVARAYRAADAASAGRLTSDPGKPVVDD